MSKYHIKPETGEVRVCQAKTLCPFGGTELHFDTEADARKAYEIKMQDLTFSELISKSNVKSEWRRKDWETERKPLIENYINKLVSTNPAFRGKKVRVKWVPLVNEAFDKMGFRDASKYFRNSSTIVLSEQAELIEETSMLRLAYHEAAHVIETKSSEDHGIKWQTATETVLKGTELEGLELQKASFSEYTPEEKVRRLHYRIKHEPKYAWIGICSNRHYAFSEYRHLLETATCPNCKSAIDQIWERDKNTEAVEGVLVQELKRRGFTNEDK